MTPRLFLDRRRSGEPAQLLDWKVRIFAIGAGLALGGMILDIGWLVTSAIVVLLAGFALRFLPSEVQEEESD
ncbi:MAG: hypothetical protein WEG36_05675 [Gemmatimonadota bacterium]